MRALIRNYIERVFKQNSLDISSLLFTCSRVGLRPGYLGPNKRGTSTSPSGWGRVDKVVIKLYWSNHFGQQSAGPCPEVYCLANFGLVDTAASESDLSRAVHTSPQKYSCVRRCNA